MKIWGPNINFPRRHSMRLGLIFIGMLAYYFGIGSALSHPYLEEDVRRWWNGPANLLSFSKSIPPGFSLFSNPLFHNRGAKMANAIADNSIGEVLKRVPEGTAVCKFDPKTQLYSYNVFTAGRWKNPRETLSPGDGAFILNPGNRPFVIVFSGNMHYDGGVVVPAGISLISSPHLRPIDFGNLTLMIFFQFTPAFSPQEGDVVSTFDSIYGRLRDHHFKNGSWDSVPLVAVGEAFFVRTAYPRWISFYEPMPL